VDVVVDHNVSRSDAQPYTLRNDTNLRLENNVVTAGLGTGITALPPAAGGSPMEGLLVRDNTLTANTGSGFAAQAGAIVGARLRDNTASGNEFTGLLIARGTLSTCWTATWQTTTATSASAL
jgi:hypothetical protein